MSDANPGWSSSGLGSQPRYGQPPPQPPRSRRDALIVGGALAGTLVFLLGIGALVYVRLGTAGDPPLPQASASPEPWFDESVLDREEPRYSWVDHLCEAIDFEPLFTILPNDGGPTQQRGGIGSSNYQECRFDLTDGGSVGRAGVNVSFAPHADSARGDFDLALRRLEISVQYQDVLQGWWEQGHLFSDTTSDTAVELLIRDDNLVVALWLVVGGAAGDLPAQEAALVSVAESIQDILRA